MIVNGKEYDFEEISVEELLNNLNLNKDRVVVEALEKATIGIAGLGGWDLI